MKTTYSRPQTASARESSRRRTTVATRTITTAIKVAAQATYAFWSSRQGVASRPIADATDVWNIIAPSTLPTARSSRPRRIHITTFIASGSSVAIGLKNSETTSGGTPTSADAAVTAVTNQCEAATVTTNASASWPNTAYAGGSAARGARRSGGG